jgi:hypothetical protein
MAETFRDRNTCRLIKAMFVKRVEVGAGSPENASVNHWERIRTQSRLPPLLNSLRDCPIGRVTECSAEYKYADQFFAGGLPAE